MKLKLPMDDMNGNCTSLILQHWMQWSGGRATEEDDDDDWGEGTTLGVEGRPATHYINRLNNVSISQK